MQRLSFELLENNFFKSLSPQGADLRSFMFDSARARRHQLPVRAVAITGSAGKTTVKELLGSLTENTFVSPANQNTKLALALQILRLPISQAFAVFEVGARRRGDFEIPLSYIQPEVVTLLNIGSAHVGEFGSLENLVAEKLSPLDYASVKTLVIPADDARIVKYISKTNKAVLTFGMTPSADIEVLRESPEGVYLKIHKESFFIECPQRAPLKGLNIAAAVATAIALGFKPNEFSKKLSQFRGVERRFQALNWQSRLAIDDSFNASPESMNEGLRHFAMQTQNMKILLVLGSMLELGEISKHEHQKVGEYIGRTFKSGIEAGHVTLVTIGTEAAYISDGAATGIPAEKIYHFECSMSAKSTVESIAKDVDVIYFKASKGILLNKIFST